jgi:hypothetical protein
MQPRHVGLLMVLVAVTACQQAPTQARGTMPSRQNVVVSPAPGADGAKPAPSAAAVVPTGATSALSTRVPVAGTLRVPKLDLAAGVRLVSDRGSGVVANNTAGLVANNASGLVAAYALTQLTSSLVEGARVYLADSAGQRIPGIAAVQTDSAGRFELPQVPPGVTFVVVAEIDTQRGKAALFRTLVKVGPLGATTSIDAASTLVTVNVLEGLPGGELGDYNPARFQQASEAASRNLRDDNMPDFTDILAVKARMDELVREVAALRDLLGEVKAELAVIRQSLDELKEATLRTPAPTGGGSTAPAILASTPAPSASRSTPTPAVSRPPASVAPGVPGSPFPVASVSPPPTLPSLPPCATAVNRVTVPSNAVARLQFRRVEAGKGVDQSVTFAELAGGGGTFTGLLPGGCAVWVVYLDAAGNRLGNPIQTTFPPMSVPSPVSLPPPVGPGGPIL